MVPRAKCGGGWLYFERYEARDKNRYAYALRLHASGRNANGKVAYKIKRYGTV